MSWHSFKVSAGVQSPPIVLLGPHIFGSSAPFVVGVWFRPSFTNAVYSLFAVNNSNGGATDNRRLYLDGTGKLAFDITDGTNTSTATVTTPTATANGWHFALLRFIAAANQKISLFSMVSGAVGHGSNVNSQVASSSTQANIGDVPSVNGGTVDIAEYWIASGTLVGVADTANIDDMLLRRLALHGPFAIPHIGENVTYYLPFKSQFDFMYARDYAVLGADDTGGGSIFGAFGAPTDGAFADHPPLDPAD